MVDKSNTDELKTIVQLLREVSNAYVEINLKLREATVRIYNLIERMES